MPLIRIPGQVAVETRKSNPFNNWGERGTPNRVEPLTQPAFDVPFRLTPGEAIFTIGSCFARNVESQLVKRGYRIPTHDIFRLAEFKTLEHSVINNYGTPSIFNEIAWAFGERPFNEDDHIIEIMPGRFADQHMPAHLRPEAREVVLARRRAVNAVYQAARDCRVVVVTLGLSEVWFDTRTGFYLNTSPRPQTLRDQPARYELHVLSYEEASGFLLDALRLLKKHGHPELRVILTVSPVPLQVTHRPMDVIVANAYSKAVLRAAAEAAVVELPFVTYYPSYESVTLSDREIAWQDDLVHVSEDIVRVNVERMVDAFAGVDAASDTAAIAEGGEAVALSRAQAARAAGGRSAAAFFAEHADWSNRSPRFAVEHARHLLDTGKAQAALAILGPHEASQDPALIQLRAEGLVATGHVAEALGAIDGLHRRVRSRAMWNTLFKAALASNDPAIVEQALTRLVKDMPGRRKTAYLQTALFFRKRREVDEAAHYFRLAVELDGEPRIAVLEYADMLVALKRRDEASKVLAGFEPQSAKEAQRFRHLRHVLRLPGAAAPSVGDRVGHFLGRMSALVRR